jgi:hypothetical protein
MKGGKRWEHSLGRSNNNIVCGIFWKLYPFRMAKICQRGHKGRWVWRSRKVEATLGFSTLLCYVPSLNIPLSYWTHDGSRTPKSTLCILKLAELPEELAGKTKYGCLSGEIEEKHLRWWIYLLARFNHSTLITK